MAWEILFHDDFDAWFDEQEESLREAIAALLVQEHIDQLQKQRDK